MTFRWPWQPKKCEACIRKDWAITQGNLYVEKLENELRDEREDRRQLIAALSLSMAPKPAIVWPPPTPEQLNAREQRDLKRMFEEKATLEFPGGVGAESTRPLRTVEERAAAIKKARDDGKPFPAEFPAIG